VYVYVYVDVKVYVYGNVNEQAAGRERVTHHVLRVTRHASLLLPFPFPFHLHVHFLLPFLSGNVYVNGYVNVDVDGNVREKGKGTPVSDSGP
jgi:hypothetical protein